MCKLISKNFFLNASNLIYGMNICIVVISMALEPHSEELCVPETRMHPTEYPNTTEHIVM